MQLIPHHAGVPCMVECTDREGFWCPSFLHELWYCQSISEMGDTNMVFHTELIVCLILPFSQTDVPAPSSGSVSVVALNETGKVRVTWSERALGSGQVITGYSVQYRRKGTTSYTTRSVSGSSTTSYTITNLNLGTVYEVRVASVGPLGLSGYCCGNGKQVTTYNSEWTVQIEGYFMVKVVHYSISKFTE